VGAVDETPGLEFAVVVTVRVTVCVVDAEAPPSVVVTVLGGELPVDEVSAVLDEGTLVEELCDSVEEVEELVTGGGAIGVFGGNRTSVTTRISTSMSVAATRPICVHLRPPMPLRLILYMMELICALKAIANRKDRPIFLGLIPEPRLWLSTVSKIKAFLPNTVRFGEGSGRKDESAKPFALNGPRMKDPSLEQPAQRSSQADPTFFFHPV
jgi:hypothetical protein